MGVTLHFGPPSAKMKHEALTKKADAALAPLLENGGMLTGAQLGKFADKAAVTLAEMNHYMKTGELPAGFTYADMIAAAAGPTANGS
jgi:hypothetical protein